MENDESVARAWERHKNRRMVDFVPYLMRRSDGYCIFNENVSTGRIEGCLEVQGLGVLVISIDDDGGPLDVDKEVTVRLDEIPR